MGNGTSWWPTDVHYWTCPACSYTNRPSRFYCIACKAARPDKVGTTVVCKFCELTVNRKSVSKHQKSLSCMAAATGKTMMARGLARIEHNLSVTSALEESGVCYEVVKDSYSKRGWGTGRHYQSVYAQPWVVALLNCCDGLRDVPHGVDWEWLHKQEIRLLRAANTNEELRNQAITATRLGANITDVAYILTGEKL